MVYMKNYLLGPLVFLAAFEFALLGVNPTFYTDDCAEFITVSTTLGVAHPPGYPLFMLVGRLMSLLPLPVFFSVNLLSALLASLICLLIFFLLEKGFKVPTLFSMAFAFMWMAGASCYPSALSAKRGIYVLAGLFVLAILASLLNGRLKLAAFLYGLSLGGHWMSMAAYGPGLVFLAYERFRQKPWNNRDLAQYAIYFLTGVSVYLYLPLRAINEPVVNWGYPHNLDLFLKHFTRYLEKGRDFTSDVGQWVQGSTYYFRTAFMEFSGLGLLALAGIVFEWKSDRRRALGLLASWAGLVAAVSIFSKFTGQRLVILEYYSVSSWVFLALFSGLGAWGLFQLWGKWQTRANVLGAILLVLSLGGVGLRVASSAQTYFTAFYDYTLNAWKSLPLNAFYFCKGDELQFSSWYFQWVEGKRPDLCVLGSSLIMDWNRINLARSHPGLKVPFPNHSPDKVYFFGPLFPWMVENNPQRRFYISFPPKEEHLEDLRLAPLGLAQEGTVPPKNPMFDEGVNDSFWANARLRHLHKPQSSVDLFIWNTVLQEYGAKRLMLAQYEMNQANILEASGRNDRAKAKEWYEKSLANLMVIQDWNPEGSRDALESGEDYGLGPLLHAAIFHREVLINIGVVYFRMGDLDQAKAWIQKATQTVPRDADIYFYTGLAAYQANNFQEARKWIKKTLESDPTYARASQLQQYMSR